MARSTAKLFIEPIDIVGNDVSGLRSLDDVIGELPRVTRPRGRASSVGNLPISDRSKT